MERKCVLCYYCFSHVAAEWSYTLPETLGIINPHLVVALVPALYNLALCVCVCVL